MRFYSTWRTIAEENAEERNDDVYDGSFNKFERIIEMPKERKAELPGNDSMVIRKC